MLKYFTELCVLGSDLAVESLLLKSIFPAVGGAYGGRFWELIKITPSLLVV